MIVFSNVISTMLLLMIMIMGCILYAYTCSIIFILLPISVIPSNTYVSVHIRMYMLVLTLDYSDTAGLVIMVICQSPFSGPFQYMTEHSTICWDKFTVHFQLRSHWQSVIMLLHISIKWFTNFILILSSM